MYIVYKWLKVAKQVVGGQFRSFYSQSKRRFDLLIWYSKTIINVFTLFLVNKYGEAVLPGAVVKFLTVKISAWVRFLAAATSCQNAML